MIAAVLAVLAVQAVPPPLMISDYFPGAWLVPVDREIDGLASDTEIIERMREAQTVLPKVRFVLCWQGGTPVRADLVRSVAARFRQGGIRRMRIARQMACADDARTRDFHGVLIEVRGQDPVAANR
jgi:hypothetical protein